MPRLSYRFLRFKLIGLGVYPQTKLARFTAALLAIDILFNLVGRTLAYFSAAKATAEILIGWATLMTFFVVVFGGILLLKWVRYHLMWRLRNRLIVTYVFIGVIPVLLLVSMALIAGWLFVGQFATFVVSEDLNDVLSKMATSNAVMTATITSDIKSGMTPAIAAQRIRPTADGLDVTPTVTLFYKGERLPVNASAPNPGPADLPAWVPAEYRGVAASGELLWLRVSRRIQVAGQPLTVVSSLPLNAPMLKEVSQDLGEVTLDLSGIGFATQQSRGIVYHWGPAQAPQSVRDQSDVIEAQPRPAADGAPGKLIVAGEVPPQQASWDRGVAFGTPFPVQHWDTGRSARLVMSVQTRISRLYNRLFLTLGDFSRIIVQVLIGIAIFFALIELFALFIGVRLTRSMTRSVAALYDATEHINRGHFKHRIRVRSHDQLAALEKAFNSMSESLEKLLQEQQEKQRIENELAIAQEVQAQLFPKHLRSLETLELHGVCRPARTVSGDYYDFLVLGNNELGLAVGDVSGKGISAALLMATINSAVRAYTLDRTRQHVEATMPAVAGFGASAGYFSNGEEVRVSVAPAELLGMLNRQLYHSTPAEKYATMFFGVYEGATRTLTYTNAGHLPPIILGADGSVRRLEAGGTVAGLFEGVTFDQASITLHTGDIFISFSDGVTEPENEFGEFGEARLLELVRENRHLPLDRITEAVTTAVRDWIGGAEQPDDITIVLARAR